MSFLSSMRGRNVDAISDEFFVLNLQLALRGLRIRMSSFAIGSCGQPIWLMMLRPG